MSVKVILTINKGLLSGRRFTFDQKESLILGRQEDCNIVFSEITVSRYHCLLDIAPPSVMVRDLGSLNGTYLNGKLIGRRDENISIHEARKHRHNEYSMKKGDCLKLGTECGITLEIAIPQYCAECLCEINYTDYTDMNHLPICSDCYMKVREQEIKDGEVRITSGNAKQNNRWCEVCGVTLPADINTPRICSVCRKNPVKVLEVMLQQALKGTEEVNGIAGYRKIRSLGRGGMGAVWLVEEEKTGKQMALKLMLPEAEVSESRSAMFLREAYIAGQLEHKNVIHQFKCGQSGDAFFILMEFCRGGSVDDLIRRNGGKLHLDQATHIMLQVLDGLHYTHHAQVVVTLMDGQTHTANGVVHRDFKPGNIFLSDHSLYPTAKLADFGLAKTFETAGLSGHTRTGDVAGTLVCMPRQQIIDYRYAKPDVDVWAAAACYYYMLTGTYPKDCSGADPLEAALNNTATPIMRHVKIPGKLAEVIDAALIDQPGIGIQSALELKSRIEEAL